MELLLKNGGGRAEEQTEPMAEKPGPVHILKSSGRLPQTVENDEERFPHT